MIFFRFTQCDGISQQHLLLSQGKKMIYMCIYIYSYLLKYKQVVRISQFIDGQRVWRKKGKRVSQTFIPLYNHNFHNFYIITLYSSKIRSPYLQSDHNLACLCFKLLPCFWSMSVRFTLGILYHVCWIFESDAVLLSDFSCQICSLTYDHMSVISVDEISDSNNIWAFS